MIKNKYYIGNKYDLSKEIVAIKEIPTRQKYGNKYAFLIGPFKSIVAAEYFLNDPECKTISDAENIIKTTHKHV